MPTTLNSASLRSDADFLIKMIRSAEDDFRQAASLTPKDHPSQAIISETIEKCGKLVFDFDELVTNKVAASRLSDAATEMLAVLKKIEPYLTACPASFEQAVHDVIAEAEICFPEQSPAAT